MAYRIRLMEPRDVPAVHKLHVEQNVRDGTNYPFNSPFDADGKKNANTLMALSVLRGDEVRQGDVVERAAELMLFGCDPRATAALHKQIHVVFYMLAQKGYTGVHCMVPKRVSWWRRIMHRLAVAGDIPKAVTRSLEDVGFERDDSRLAHFYINLPPAEQG